MNGGASTTNREGPGDYLKILSGTSQNVLGIAIAAAATLGANLLISNTLGRGAFGLVTVLTQAAFVLSFLTRAGMDMAVLRNVAVEIGEGRNDRVRAAVARAALIAAVVSGAVALVAIAFAGPLEELLPGDAGSHGWAVQAAAVGLPFLAVTNVWLSATRGLKIMRYTLYVFWAGQPVVWIALMLLAWAVAQTTSVTVLAYSLSWAVASIAALYFWQRESRGWNAAAIARGGVARLLRFAGPRAPAALFSQLLFWTDLFVLTQFASQSEVGVYSAALRTGQVVVLFLTSVNLMFSPYVADLHNRGETRRLDRLFKTLTRWTLAATLPGFVLLAVAPEPVLRLFGGDFAPGQTALLILLAGQLVNVATGSVGFVLIMAGRTGWDLAVYAASFVFDIGLALWLVPRYGIEGAAIANAATFAVSNSARLLLVKRFVHIQPYDRNYLRLLVPAVVAGAAMALVHRTVTAPSPIDLTATAAAGLLAYAVTYAAVGLTPTERHAATGLLARLNTTRG